MNPILRVYPTSRSASILVSSIYQRNITFSSRRLYSQSDYGGEDQTRRRQAKMPKDSPTRRMEHPGPNPSPNSFPDSFTFQSPPPATSNATQHAPDSCETAERPTHPSIPSNKAHPTLNDGRQSPNVDVKGNRSGKIPEDVERHNAELRGRHARSYNRIPDEGGVVQGFTSGET